MDGRLQAQAAPVKSITWFVGPSPRGSLFQSPEAETFNSSRAVRLHAPSHIAVQIADSRRYVVSLEQQHVLHAVRTLHASLLPMGRLAF